MRVGARTTLVLLAVAVVPVAIAGWTTRSLSRAALIERAEEAAVRGASTLATRLADSMGTRLHAVELAAAAIDLDALAADDRVWAMRLVFRQVPNASAVALIDSDGSPVGSPVYLDEKAADPALAQRPVLTPADLDLFGAGIPHQLASEVGRSFGVPYVSSAGAPRIVVAVRATSRYVLAVELSLDGLVDMLDEHGLGMEGTALAVDGNARVILSADLRAVAKQEARTDLDLLEGMSDGRKVGSFRDRRGIDMLGAAVAVPELGWVVVVAEPLDDALAIAHAVTTRMVAWMLVALLGALVLGVLSSRALVQPLERLAVGARQIKDGNIEHRVEGEDRTDELGDLARAFNRMAEEVERWRNELEDKVELRTRELKESQELLARAQKMAAVGQLGAGVAHEINNPLFALAGMAELLQADEEEGSKRHGKLGMIRKQAERIEVIVARLLAMADAAEGGQLHEHDVRESLGTAVERARELTGDSDIELKLEIDQVLPVRASSAELQEVFFAVLENAFDALGERGTIQVTVSVVDGQMVRVRIEDDGPGIARDLQHRIFDPFFTKSAKRGAKGLGLSTAQQIVSAHDGKILLESEEGKGTMVAVLLPVAQKRARR